MASEGRAAVGDDPHASYRVDRGKYLVIGENGEYRVSHKPQQIPKDVVVEAIPADKCREGIRHFKVGKAGVNSYDLVSVGTITIQNGYAYVAGNSISGETPDRSNEFIIIPPFVIQYPLELPKGMDLETYGKERMQTVHNHLRDEVAKYHGVGPRLLEFDLNMPYAIDQPNLCKKCEGPKYEGGFDFCDACDYDEADVSSSINHGGSGGDKVETHKASMYTDVEEDNYLKLEEKFVNCELLVD